MILPFYIGKTLKAYFAVASEDRRALLNTELFNTDPLSCKKEYLPLLAVEAGVEIDGFAEPIQRQLIANAFKSFAKAGTVGALKGALNAIAPMELQEQKNFIFSVKMSYLHTGVYTQEHFNKILNTIEKSKNVRSVLEAIEIDIKAKETVYVSSAFNMQVGIDKDLDLTWIDKDINTGSALSVQIGIARDMEVKWKNENINFTGVVIWQV